MSISEKLKQARLSKGLTQETVAEKVCVSRQTVSNWENGKTYPDIASLIVLSDVYDMTLDSLLKGDDKMIKHLKESTEVTKSNKQLGKALIISLSIFTAMTLINIFVPNAPLINSLAANIIIMALFVFITIMVVVRSVDIKGFSEKKTSNIILLKVGALILYMLFYIPLVLFIPEAINSDFGIETAWIQAIIRVATAGVLFIPAYAIHKKTGQL